MVIHAERHLEKYSPKLSSAHTFAGALRTAFGLLGMSAALVGYLNETEPSWELEAGFPFEYSGTRLSVNRRADGSMEGTLGWSVPGSGVFCF